MNNSSQQIKQNNQGLGVGKNYNNTAANTGVGSTSKPQFMGNNGNG